MITLPTNPSNRSASLAVITNQQTWWIVMLAFPLLLAPVWCLTAPEYYGGRVGTVSGLVLFLVLGVSALTDLTRHKIYNWATYSTFAWALTINIATTCMSSGEEALLRAYHRASTVAPEMLGGVGLSQCLIGAGVCFFITLAGYHLSGSGAGDVKLATVIGALLGFHQGVYAVAYSYMVAGAAIVVWSIYNNGPLALAQAAGRTIGAVLGPLWPLPPTTSDTALLMRPIPLGPYFAIGTMLVVLEIVPS